MKPLLQSHNTPEISVVVPAYKVERFLEETIQSVLSQTYSNWELILVDDGSPDRTFEIASHYADQYPHRIRVFSQPNSGPASARNTGYSFASPASTYVAFLDGDDLWEPDALEVLLAELKANPDAYGVHARARLIDSKSRVLPDTERLAGLLKRHKIENGTLVTLPLDGRTEFSALVFDNCIVTPGVTLLQKAALEEVGGFDPELFGTEDWELWVRISRARPFVFLDHIVLNYRQHEANISRRKRSMNLNTERARVKMVNSPQNSPEQRRLSQLGWQLHTSLTYRNLLEAAKKDAQQGHFVLALRRARHAFHVRKRLSAPLP